MLTDPRLCRGFSIGRTEKIWYTEEVVGCLIIKLLLGLTSADRQGPVDSAAEHVYLVCFYIRKQPGEIVEQRFHEIQKEWDFEYFSNFADI